MNQLPIVLISKQLKYMLTYEKIKTLEKALEMKDSIPDQLKKKTIQNVGKKYQTIKNNVHLAFQKLNNEQLIKGQNLQQMDEENKVKIQKIYDFLVEPCICEIYGAKGTGKTSLMLHFLLKYMEIHFSSQKGIKGYIFNGASGITQKRMTRLLEFNEKNQIRLEYYDCGIIQDIIKITGSLLEKCKEGKLQQRKNIIVVDSMVSLLLGQQKTKPLVCKVFRNFSQLQRKFNFTIIFTNLVQHKYQVGSEQLYNHTSYHSQYHNEFINNKLYLERPGKNGFRFNAVELKNIRPYRFWFQIGEEGVQKVGMDGIENQ